MDRDIIDHKDGWLCVKSEYPKYSEPILVRVWYPICQAYIRDCEDLLGKKVDRDSHNPGIYFYRNHLERSVRILLKDLGKTKPIAFETSPIPPPKVRKNIEIRYMDGHWQKYLKSKGWVFA
jgi:hypothetical protein